MKNAGSKRIAERYVKALFDVASKEGIVTKVEQDLLTLSGAIEGSQELRDFIVSPILGREGQAKVMEELLKKIRVQKLTVQFVGLLARQKRLPILPAAAKIFAQWAGEERGELTAEVTTASKLSAKAAKDLAANLSKTYGKKINLHLSEDPSLLGGMVVKIGSQQLDSSLAGKLQRLKQTLAA